VKSFFPRVFSSAAAAAAGSRRVTFGCHLLLLNIASHLQSREGKFWVTKSTKEKKLFPFMDFFWHSF
jgi:hypothetical protein